MQRPAAFAIVCFCLCEFHTVSYSGSCAEQVADFAQSMLVFVLPLIERETYLKLWLRGYGLIKEGV